MQKVAFGVQKYGTNRKSHTRFRLLPKSTILDDLEGSLCTLFKTCATVFRSRLKTHLFNISYPCDCTVPAQWL